MPAPVTIPSISTTWTPETLPVDAFAEAGSASQPVGLGSAKSKFWYFTPRYSIKAFGAVGDGVTDDTAAINAAIAAIYAIGGGTVMCPRGNYRITSMITVSAGVTLEGEGMSEEWNPVNAPTQFLKDGTFTGIKVLRQSGLCNITVQGTAVAGVPTNGGDGIWVNGDTAKLWAVGVYYQGARGIFVGATDATGVNWGNFQMVTSGKNAGDGWWFDSPATNANGHYLIGCRAWQNTGYGFRLGNTRYNGFYTCYAEANVDKGWKVQTTAIKNIFVCPSAEPLGGVNFVFDAGSVDNQLIGAGAIRVTDVTDNGKNLIFLPESAEGTGGKGSYTKGQIRAGNDPQYVAALASEHGFLASGTKPGYNFYDENGPDSAHRVWEMFADAGSLFLKIVNFAGTVRNTLWTIVRSAADSATMTFSTKCIVRFAYPPIVPSGTYSDITTLAAAGGLNNGALAVMTDLTVSTPGTIATAGGTKRCLVWCDGTGGAYIIVSGQ